MLLGFFLSLMWPAQALTTTATIQSARGTAIEITAHIPNGARLPAVIVAPGMSCNAKAPLFDEVALAAVTSGVAVFRFEWEYCARGQRQPEFEDLRNELADIESVHQFVKNHGLIDEKKIVFLGKSMGSRIAYALFQKLGSSIGFVALTPVCTYTTDDNNRPLPSPLPVGEKYYPGISAENRPVLMVPGNQDEMCLIPYFYDFLKDTKGNVSALVASGDHGYRVFNSQRQVDVNKTNLNLKLVAQNVANWIQLNLL